MSRGTWLSVGAVVLIVDAVQWVVSEAVTAGAWKNPVYSYATNYISDLGVPDCGTQFQGRELCSPRHALMNTSFMVEGVLFAIGVVLLARLLDGRARRVVMALAVAHGVGMVAVGLFHGSPGGPSHGLALHIGGAGVGILSANTVVILAGALRSLRPPTAYRVFSVVVGALGIAGVALVGMSESTAGIFERAGVYSWLLWSVVTGVLLLTRRARRPSMPENVPA
ncbi:DUF998 domain-containing protein [Streptomyces sp. NPDC093249]|uniref:DUF998 domain-containing protein n=1 Tax=unclassified Streptomyces TaxID=2593676 RepID=UPI00344F0925